MSLHFLQYNKKLDYVYFENNFCLLFQYSQMFLIFQGEDYSNDDSPIDEDEMDGLLRDAMNITGGSILTSRRRRNVRSVAQQRRIIRNSISRNTQTSYNRPININQVGSSLMLFFCMSISCLRIMTLLFLLFTC